MLIRKDFILVIFLALTSFNVFSEPSGNSIAYTAAYSLLTIEDPDGPTESVSEFSPYQFSWRSNLSRKSRYKAKFYYSSFKTDASTFNIGQEVTQLDVSISYQKKFNISRSIHPYFGLGVSYSKFEAIARHNIDDAGFLSSTFPDLKDDVFYVLFNSDIEFEINEKFDYGFTFLHREPLSGGVRDTSIGFSIIYKL